MPRKHRYTRPGRPKGSCKPPSKRLVEAIATVEKRKGKDLYEHFIETALKDPSVLIATMRKLLPDLKALDALIGVSEGQMTEEEAAQIQKVLRKRMMGIHTAALEVDTSEEVDEPEATDEG